MLWKVIFYGFGLLAIIYEMWSIRNYHVLEGMRIKLNKKQKEELTENESILAGLMFLYMAWAFVGLFSSQWLLFLGLFGLSFLNAVFMGKRWNTVDSLLSIGLIFFAIINTFHLHIPLAKNIWEFFT